MGRCPQRAPVGLSRTENLQGSSALAQETPVPPLLWRAAGPPQGSSAPSVPLPMNHSSGGGVGGLCSQQLTPRVPALGTDGAAMLGVAGGRERIQAQPASRLRGSTTAQSASRLELGECGPFVSGAEGWTGAGVGGQEGQLKGAAPAPGPPDLPRPQPGHCTTSTARPAGVREEAEPLLQLQGFQGLLRHPFLQGGAPRARVCSRAGCQ